MRRLRQIGEEDRDAVVVGYSGSSRDGCGTASQRLALRGIGFGISFRVLILLT